MYAAHQQHIAADPHIVSNDDLMAVDVGELIFLTSVKCRGERIGRDRMMIVVQPQIEGKIVRERAVSADEDMRIGRGEVCRPAHQIATRIKRHEWHVRMILDGDPAHLWRELKHINDLNQIRSLSFRLCGCVMV